MKAFPWLLVLALLLGCNQAPSQPAVPLAEMEITGTLRLPDEEVGITLSTIKDRFRIEREGKIFIGSIKDRSWGIIVHPDSKRYYHFSQERYRALWDRHDEMRELRTAAIARRHDSAPAKASMSSARGLLGRILQSPCERMKGNFGGHTKCEFSGEDLVVFHHEVSRRSAINAGYKKTVRTVEHQYDTKLGLLISEVHDSYRTSFQDIKAVELDLSVFGAPEGYQEMLTDEVLEETTPEILGWESMVEGETLRCFPDAMDHPSPPSPLQWVSLKEKWRVPGDRPPKLSVHIETFAPQRGQDLTISPLKVGHTTKATQWDSDTLVGERSFQKKENEIVFTQNGRLYSVGVYPKAKAGILLPVCRKLAAKAQERATPKKTQ